jgi:lipid-A-disaccharide synthase
VDAIAGEVMTACADMQAPYRVIKGQSERYQAFRASKFAIAASGTVTLELTACGTPHIVAYRFSHLTNLIVKSLITTKFANLLNIFANRMVIPEFMGKNCNANSIYAKALELMQNPLLAQEQVIQAQGYFGQLKPETMMPSEKAAAVVLACIPTPP